VYVFFGKSGVLAYDFAGKELWHTEVGTMLDNFGSGSSPALYRNLLLVNASVEGGRLVALDKTSGKIVWRARFYGDCWTTPVIVNVPGGKAEVVLFTPEVLISFDPEDGKELWRCECHGPEYVSATPVVSGDIVYLMGAGKAGRLFQAVRAGGRGDVTKSHIVWKQKVGASFCSPVLVGDRLYLFSGRACCLRADTGAIVFQERLDGLGTEYASPVAADGKIYLFTRDGRGHVLAAKDRLEELAVQDLGEPGGFTASPAISHGQLLVRSNRYLYCFGEKK
jgi:outer membrane protein assembly factor BamB